MIAADSDGKIQSQEHSVGKRQLDLRGTTAGTQHTDTGKHPTTWPHHRHCLMSREVTRLVQFPIHLQLGTRAKEHLQMFLREVHVPGRYVDDQRVGGSRGGSRLWCRDTSASKCLTDHPLDLAPF